jgi:hypothetical protein
MKRSSYGYFYSAHGPAERVVLRELTRRAKVLRVHFAHVAI